MAHSIVFTDQATTPLTTKDVMLEEGDVLQGTCVFDSSARTNRTIFGSVPLLVAAPWRPSPERPLHLGSVAFTTRTVASVCVAWANEIGLPAINQLIKRARGRPETVDEMCFVNLRTEHLTNASNEA